MDKIIGFILLIGGCCVALAAPALGIVCMITGAGLLITSEDGAR